jgi:DNA (cytosine-5)-methyltransferase 1
MTNTKPCFLSVFSGAGGLDLGLEAAGFNCISSIEIEETARETLRLNRPEWPQFKTGDICKVAHTANPRIFGLKKGQLDLLAGAPPCQPFSTAAQWTQNGKRGLLDPRASTLGAFMALVETLQPKLFLIENVPGFASPKNGALHLIEGELSKFKKAKKGGYSLHIKLIDCADFGVPQKRKRIIIIGSRIGEMRWPLPSTKLHRTAWDALHNLTPSNPEPAKGKWADLLPTIPEGENYMWHTSNGRGSEIFGDRTRFWSFLLKLSKNRPSWTLSAQPGPSTGPFHWENRPLTPVEAMRLQTFPDGWRLAGTLREQIHLVGNATPPLLSEKIGRCLRAMLDGSEAKGPLKHLIKKAGIAAVPSEIQEIPARYLSLIGPKAAHPGSGKGPNPRHEHPQSLYSHGSSITPDKS